MTTTRSKAAPLAVPLARADELLLARHGTTAALVRAGRLRAIPWGRRTRVLVADVERIAAEGITPELQRPRSPRRRPTPAGAGAAILGIDLDGLSGASKPPASAPGTRGAR